MVVTGGILNKLALDFLIYVLVLPDSIVLYKLLMFLVDLLTCRCNILTLCDCKFIFAAKSKRKLNFLSKIELEIILKTKTLQYGES